MVKGFKLRAFLFFRKNFFGDERFRSTGRTSNSFERRIFINERRKSGSKLFRVRLQG